MLISGLSHEMGHRFSLKIFGHRFEEKPFRTIILNYEHLTNAEKKHMLFMGILFGLVPACILMTWAPLSPFMYLTMCHSDIKELIKLKR